MQNNAIPFQYKRVNCIIKEDSTQCIDTLIPLQPTLYLKMFQYEIIYTGHSATPLFGARTGITSQKKFGLWVNANKYSPAINYASLDSGYITSVDGRGRHSISNVGYPNVDFVFDGSSIWSATALQDNPVDLSSTLHIFDILSGNTTLKRAYSAKLYGICIANDSGDLFDAVPVVRKSDNKAGLYDIVSNGFFTDKYSDVTSLTFE